ncbi:MAG: hypothetical protein QOE70_1008 [Chthoniobacter sp.]|jgi:hypothetical protein|nr:hypothetical protein [Chthoniobacter sp.]
MLRSLAAILFAGLCAGRAIAAPGPDKHERPRPRPVPASGPVAPQEVRTRAIQRSLFRTSGSRLFAPAVPVVPAMPIGSLPARPDQPRVVVPPASPATRATALPASSEPARIPPGAGELTLERTSFTPYDRYLGAVRRVIADLDGRNANMVTACALMREGRSFRYSAADPYRADSPETTDARRAGDCKAKALWLYDHLGDPAALFVIGKLERRSPRSHAWVYWRHDERWWILDPTARFAPIAADSVSPSRYVPYYSYGRGGAYRHRTTSLMLATASISVASRQ